MKTTKSSLALARRALASAQRTVPAYSCPKSRHTFTQPQLLACLIMREALQVDYRALATMIDEWKEMRLALGLTRAPHWTTLHKAAQRFEKKTSRRRFWRPRSGRCRPRCARRRAAR